jgi:Na+-transporting NADH:ubiquinone oxidoreductase subunit NqrB
MEENNFKAPLWETLTMIASFALLWAWFVVFKSTPPRAQMAPYWKVLLALSILALLWVLVRRMKRVSEAFKEHASRPPNAPPNNAKKKGSRDTKIK